MRTMSCNRDMNMILWILNPHRPDPPVFSGQHNSLPYVGFIFWVWSMLNQKEAGFLTSRLIYLSTGEK